MSIFLYLAGLLVGVTAFLYIMSAINSGKEKLQSIKKEPGGPPKKKKIEPQKVVVGNLPPRTPGTRMCPLCGSFLEKWEALYSTQVESPQGSKILIHGCRYCYKSDDDAGEEQQSHGE